MNADIVLVNCTVYTMDKENTIADSVVIKDNRIVGIGDFTNVKSKKLDLKGRVVLPGFIDCHTHFVSMGLSKSRLDLSKTNSLNETLGKVARVVNAGKSGWVIGVGFDESKWFERRYPTKYELDNISTDVPIVLKRVCGHLAVANTKALEIISEKYPVRTDGILIEDVALHLDEIVGLSDYDIEKSILWSIKKAHSYGVTSIHEIIRMPDCIRVYQKLLREKKLNIRVYLYIEEKYMNDLIKLGFSCGFGNEYLRFGGVKIFMDGTFGARTAALSESYEDDPENTGVLLHDSDKLNEMVETADNANLQVIVHAIGDRAIEQTLNAFERVSSKMRHRIEHYELVPDLLLEKTKNLGLLVCLQPNFVVRWYEMYESRLGKRNKYNNRFKSILESIHMMFGSDCMPFSPLYGLQGAVNHPNMEERISLHDAIKCYTIKGAYASFEENLKGSIEVGKLADMVVLSGDPFTNDIKNIHIAMTIFDGKIYTSF